AFNSPLDTHGGSKKLLNYKKTNKTKNKAKNARPSKENRSRTMNSEAIIECVPNFSEGTDATKVTQIVAAMQVEGVRLLDWSLDKAHNRSVVTIAGTRSGVVEAAVLGAGKAAELIDLTKQNGVHPRIGAADVVPFIPVSGASLAECAVLARQAGLLIWR